MSPVTLRSNRGIPASVRVLAVTDCALGSLTQDGKFRQELLFRLNVIYVVALLLRARRENTQGSTS
jgi:two-component system C4-dicarboxylate transport response regulator DctD